MDVRRAGLAALALAAAFGLGGCACTPHVTDFSAASSSASTSAAAPSAASVAPTATASATPAVAANQPLDVAGVQRVLVTFDRPDPTFSSYALDAPAYAASIIRQGRIYIDTADPSIGPSTYADPSTPTQKALPADKAASVLAEALKVFASLAQRKGLSAAMDALNAQSQGGAADQTQNSHEDQLLALLAEPLVTTDFMFGRPATGTWTWTVRNIDLTGPNTARVTYSVAAPKGASWHFTRTTFAKELHFGTDAQGRWVLDGWPNYVSFADEVQKSVKPASAVPNSDLWWESIGESVN